MEDRIMIFIKAIDNQYFDSFVNQGQICMNTVEWFREYEKTDSNIGDEFEGVSAACGNGFKIHFGDPIETWNSEEELKQKLDATQWSDPLEHGINLKMFYSNNNANIFSLYAVCPSNISYTSGCYLVSPRFLEEFNNHRFVLFIDPDAIFSKIQAEITKLGKQPEKGLVSYYPLDEKLRKDLTLFDKPNKYEYQNEFRLVFKNENAVQQIFTIGPINDFCREIDLSKKCTLAYNKNSCTITKVEE